MMSDMSLTVENEHGLRSSTRQGSVDHPPVFSRLLLLVITVGGLVDIPANYAVGPVSILGILTILYMLLAWLGCFVRPVFTRSTLVAVWSLVTFVGWGLFTCLWHTPTKEGIQNLVVIVAFVGLILLSARTSRNSPVSRLLEKRLAWVTWIAVALLGVSIISSPRGAKSFLVGHRTSALFVLFGIAYYLAQWRYGLRRGIWYAVVISAVIFASMSRVAMVIALTLFVLAQFSRTSLVRWVRMGLLAILMLVVLYLVVTRIDPLRARFFGGDRAFQVGSLTLNTSGRTKFWSTVVDSFVESPWIGKGAGTAQLLITAQYSQYVEHPHNDYLRLLHDYGLVGLGLWLLGIGSLAWVTMRAWMKNDRKHPAEAQLHMTALLSLVAISLAMITDNAVIYVFLMAPLAVIVGASLGRVSLDQQWVTM